jgi:hypothetical protein
MKLADGLGVRPVPQGGGRPEDRYRPLISQKGHLRREEQMKATDRAYDAIVVGAGFGGDVRCLAEARAEGPPPGEELRAGGDDHIAGFTTSCGR